MIEERRASRAGRRVLALLAALVMVGASLAVRRFVLDEGDGGGGGGGGGDGGGAARLTCATELAAACTDIEAASDGDVEVTVEPAGDTAARLSGLAAGADPGLDGWLTLAPFPEIVREARRRAGHDSLLGEPGPILARSPLVLAVRADRAAVLGGHCEGGTVGWRCLGEVAGRSWADLGGQVTWGSVKPAHQEPVASAAGLLVLGQVVGHFLTTPDLPVERIAKNDWENNGDFPGWFQRLETSVPRDAFAPGAGRPFARFLQGRLAAYDAVGALEAEVGPALVRAADTVRDDVTVVYPDPVATADVVFAPIAGSREAERLGERVRGDDARASLAAAGWRVDGEPRADGVTDTPLPDGTGLPPAGALVALAGLWEEVVR